MALVLLVDPMGRGLCAARLQLAVPLSSMAPLWPDAEEDVAVVGVVKGGDG